MQEIIGQLHAENARIAIVVSRFNELITGRLLEGAIDGLLRLGLTKDLLTVVWVPGAVEIPVTAQRLARSERFDAIICLGAVIRGATDHYDYVAGNCATGLNQVSLESNLPVVFGVLTLESIEQGLERAGSKVGNKGFEAAMTAVEMINVLRQLPAGDKGATQFQQVSMKAKV